jgi:hypothetical protein
MENQMTTPNVQSLSHMTVISLDITAFGGKTVLSAEDLGDVAEELPADIVDLGSKKIVNTKTLRPFMKLRKRAQRAMLDMGGTKFLGAYGFAEEKFNAAYAKANEIQTEWEQETQAFLKEYPDHILDWANAHPEWKDKILQSAPAVAEIEKRIQFNIRAFKVATPVPGDNQFDGNLTEELAGIAGQVVQEIAQDVKGTWKGGPESGVAGDRTTQAVKRLLKRVSDKAESLSFVDTRLSKIAKLVSTTAATLPSTGTIEGRDYLMVKGLMDMLLDPKALLEQALQNDLAVIVPSPEPAPEPEPVLQLAVAPQPELPGIGAVSTPVVMPAGLPGRPIPEPRPIVTVDAGAWGW